MEIQELKKDLTKLQKLVKDKIKNDKDEVEYHIRKLNEELLKILKDTMRIFSKNSAYLKSNIVYNQKNIEVYFHVVDKYDEEHKEWHLINGGRRSYTPIFVAFPMYENNDRTKPNSLEVKFERTRYLYSASGKRRYFYLDNRTRIKKHSIAEIKPREWYKLALRKLINSNAYKDFQNFLTFDPKIKVKNYYKNYKSVSYKKVN